MTDIAQKTSEKKVSKKEARKIVSEKIATALAEYRTNLKEKKFENNLKKASKLFATDIARAISRQKQKLQKPAKIKAVKNTEAAQPISSAEAVV